MQNDSFEIVGVAVADAARHRNRLRAIFRDAVLFTGHQRYSGEHVVAWSMAADDLDRWDARLRTGALWIAARPGGDAMGFAVLDPRDHVDQLYVDPEFARRGIAGALLVAIADEARRCGIGELTTDASLVAEPVFSRAGYAVVGREISVSDGLGFERARMRLSIA